MKNVIMNPPYDGNTHLKILNNVVEEFPNAEIVNIAPHAWLTDPLVDYCSNEKYFRKTREHVQDRLCDDVDIIDKDTFNREFGANSYFGVAITHYKKGQNFDINQYKNKDPLVNKILQKVVKMNSLRSKYIRKPDVDNPLFVPCRRRNYHKMKWADYKSNAKEGILFKTENERDNFIESFALWIYKYLNQFPLGENSAEIPYLEDYTKRWTDQQLYDLFELDKNEINQVIMQINDK